MALLALVVGATGTASLITGTGGRVYAANGFQAAVTLLGPSGPITEGGSAVFTMQLPSGAACQGSGASNYRWETFLVSASVDPATLTWNAGGPNPISGAVVTAQFNSFGEQVSSKFPSNSPLGLISGMNDTSLPNTLSPLAFGDYKIGVACQLSGTTQEFWSTTITVSADALDAPLGIHWAVAVAAPTTTTTTAVTTTTSAVTTTTSAVATTTTSAVGVTTVTTTAVDSSGQVPTTGTNSAVIAMWALLALIMGRMALLSGRRVKVLPPRAR
jgi:hypothetical protein